jgi:hypothetical protein
MKRIKKSTDTLLSVNKEVCRKVNIVVNMSESCEHNATQNTVQHKTQCNTKQHKEKKQAV